MATTRWSTIEHATSDSLFLLMDQTGDCVVDPDGATVHSNRRRRWQGSGRKPGYVTETAHAEAPVGPVLAGKIVVSAPARLSGRPEVGSTLKVVEGTPDPVDAVVERQWLRNGRPIAGATDPTYRLTGADASATGGNALAVGALSSAAGSNATAVGPGVDDVMALAAWSRLGRSAEAIAALQALERLKLRAVEVATHPRTGVDVAALAAVLRGLQNHVIDRRRQRVPPDFTALRAMLFYIDEFPEQRHHRKESAVLFPKLRARTPLARRLLTKAAETRVDDLHAHYGDSHVLRGVSFAVEAGQSAVYRWSSYGQITLFSPRFIQ